MVGCQFLVMHDVCVKRDQLTEVGFLCLLCERRLLDNECYAHVFSREHVATFLVSVFIHISYCIIFPLMVTVMLLLSHSISCDYLGCWGKGRQTEAQLEKSNARSTVSASC